MTGVSKQNPATDSPRPLTYTTLKHLLSKRDADSHKGKYGHVLVIGGDRGFGGAALMASESAARAGAGLVSVATRSEHVAAFLGRRPEVMSTGVESDKELKALLPHATVLVIGPGLGQSEWSRICLQLALQSLADNPVPLVVDADGLNLIAQGVSRDILSRLEPNWILTPHPGEAARLLDSSTAEVQRDRAAACRELQSRYGGVAILKGAGTLIAWEQGTRQQLEICKHGNPGMASGGMGDVLSGVLGGLLAQRFSAPDSARLGACIHSYAADLIAARDGERGLLATDLLPYIHQLANN